MNEREQSRSTESASSGGMVRRIGGYLHRVVPVAGGAGKAAQYVLLPLMVEFRPRDLMQVIVGASILAVPVAFTEETWRLGETLPAGNVIALSTISLLFIGLFVYFNFYRYVFREHVVEYVKRVAAIYLLSLFVVGVLLSLIGKCPWGTDAVLALKRILIVAFPASMSAAVSDTLK
ncbi:DUF2391 family protein [Kiritimatiella glycovorans]|uniref:Integral membrane protein n=1 Tax=Kiritimatiella glycovorans TaxID=1307763 RepID=A0A0G3EAP4_9BACT|nr:DUF2391 family protein [Kiritimatiella glycovorans]AKJ63323.1 hypothetical protein L21SP4_00034 [Kiritimatiella glycovorans]